MKKIKYKDQNRENYKKIIIVLFVMIFILLCVFNILGKIGEKTESVEIDYNNISTIREVIEYHKSQYISEKESTLKGFVIDVYLRFKVLPYTDNISNETYYNKLLEDSAKILMYRNFRMIDEENNIVIKVICDGKKIVSIIINDIEDYFIYNESIISLENYEEIKTTDFSITSEVLQACINNKWSKNTYLGERESIFERYYIYFDEGIKARIIDEKIYNIVFTKMYKGNVIENLFPGIDFSNVKAVLGEPTFEDENINVIGYKGELMYVFFTENEISVYRNSTVDADDFFKLTDKFITEELDLLDFMNELTYLWPDYSDYNYSSTTVFISYPLKGVEIKINYDDTNGILLYNNIKSSLQKTSRYLENTYFIGRLQKDLVYEAEKRRFESELNLKNKCKEYEESLDNENKNIIGTSMDYQMFLEKDDNGYIYSVKFISKNGETPNRELNDGISSYLWLTNKYFLYSKENSGIYFYNLETGKVQRIITGNEKYDLKGFENGILKYDNQERILQF